MHCKCILNQYVRLCHIGPTCFMSCSNYRMYCHFHIQIVSWNKCSQSLSCNVLAIFSNQHQHGFCLMLCQFRAECDHSPTHLIESLVENVETSSEYLGTITTSMMSSNETVQDVTQKRAQHQTLGYGYGNRSFCV